MTHLDAMRAELAAMEALHKGVKRKGNPDYVLDPVTKRYKRKEPKAKGGKKAEAAPVTPEPPTAHGVASQVAEVLQGEG